jgi:hypothetical protein
MKSPERRKNGFTQKGEKENLRVVHFQHRYGDSLFREAQKVKQLIRSLYP